MKLKILFTILFLILLAGYVISHQWGSFARDLIGVALAILSAGYLVSII